MDEILKIEEIHRRFPDQWVALDQPRTTEAQEVLEGKVIAHSQDREEVHQAIMQLPVPRRFAVFYTGVWPGEDEAVAF